MRKLRFLSVLFFVVACALFAAFHLYDSTKENNHAPEIVMDSNTVTVSVKDGESALLSGVTASDKEDGDVTASLFVETTSNFITDDSRNVTIVAVDSEGAVAKATREVIYSDYTSPRFTLSAPLRFPVKTTDIVQYFGAEDVFDGDLGSSVKVTGKYTLSSDPGDYPMEFTVANSAGDVSRLEATVTLYNAADEKMVPEIGLTDYLVYVKKGQKIDPKDYLDTITYRYTTYENNGNGYFYPEDSGDVSDGGDEEDEEEDSDRIRVSSVKIDSAVDYNTPGSYEITYSYTQDGDEGTVRLIVVVEE